MFDSIELSLFDISKKPEAALAKTPKAVAAKKLAPLPILPRVMPIIEEEAARRGYTVQELIGKTRDEHLVTCRHYAMWRAKRETGRSLPEIGRVFGGRDHSSILYAVRKIEAMAPEVRESIGRRPPVAPPPKRLLVTIGGDKPARRKKRAELYESEHTCIRCGGTLRYTRTRKCAPCEQRRQVEYRWRRQEAKRAARQETAE